jgi:diguanylate cyclase (GGDEF)-like protein/PAS domain S-box-containing protein
MVQNPFRQITQSSHAMLEEQYANLRAQIPLMYLLMIVDALFLGVATHGQVPLAYSMGIPAVLCVVTALRACIWLARRGRPAPVQRIRRYLMGTVIGAAVISAAFGGWGLLLLDEADPVRSMSIALYIFVGAISACHCLRSLPLAGWFVLIFGALPVTLRLVTSHDWYLIGIGVTFILASGLLLRTMASSFAAFQELLQSRSDMGALIEALQSSQEHYRHSVDLNPQIPWIADATGALTELSPRWTALTGLPLADSLGEGWARAVHPDDLPHVQVVWQRALTTGEDREADTRYRLRLRDGTWRWFRARAFARHDAQGKVLSWYGNLEDIEEQVVAERGLQESEERYRLASLASNDIILDIALDEDRIDWGGAAATIFGYDVIAHGATRRWWLERIHPADRDRVLGQVRRLAQDEACLWQEDFRFRAADRSWLDLTARGHMVRDRHGRPARLICTLQDVTARKRYEETLRWAAHYDALTHLPNRTLFTEKLEAALEDARRARRHVALVVLDVDRFKTVNDSMGHDGGDALLCEIAQRLTRKAPSSAMVARLGGDEFAIILPDLADGVERARLVESLLADLAGPMMHDGRQIEVSLSAGSAMAFADGETTEDLHKSADLALYAAKSEGVGRLRYFQPDMRDAAARRAQMLSNARAALRDDRIVPFYQPKVCLRTGRCAGFEALLRWHDHRGLQRPASIMAAFDDPRLSLQLTDRMLDLVIADMVGWQAQGIAFHSVAINGSAGDFMRGDFAERILARLHGAGLPPGAIELEVTETVFLGQLAETVSAALTTLAGQGVTIALDDFGTGYASLTHLKQFPVDSLKIDRSFVSMLGVVETEDAAIVGAVIDLANNLGIRTVAEGIETPEQLAHLVVKGCDVGQGYLLGRPMAGGQVADVIARWDDGAVAALCANADWETSLRKVHQRGLS